MFDVRPMEDVAAGSIARPRFVMTLLALFSGVAVAMAALGLYAVIAYTVGERTREIGIRVALGARQTHVLRLVVGSGLLIGGVGLAVGLAGALGATRLLRGLLYGVGPADGVTFGATSLLVLASALLATWLPARHAARVDPVTALRAE
jgi:putative ABC transport system permease protein